MTSRVHVYGVFDDGSDGHLFSCCLYVDIELFISACLGLRFSGLGCFMTHYQL